MPISSNDMDGDADQTFIWGTNLSGAQAGCGQQQCVATAAWCSAGHLPQQLQTAKIA